MTETGRFVDFPRESETTTLHVPAATGVTEKDAFNTDDTVAIPEHVLVVVHVPT